MAANAGKDSLKPRFYVDAHLESLFGETSQRTEQESPTEERAGSAAPEQEERPAPAQLPTSLSPEEQEHLAQENAQRHDWIEEPGAQDRSATGRGSQRVADLQVSTTDPDATLMLTKNGADLGIRAYIPIPDMDHRTEFFSADQFRYEAERDIYLCPAGKELRFDRTHSRCAVATLSSTSQRIPLY